MKKANILYIHPNFDRSYIYGKHINAVIRAEKNLRGLLNEAHEADIDIKVISAREYEVSFCQPKHTRLYDGCICGTIKPGWHTRNRPRLKKIWKEKPVVYLSPYSDVPYAARHDSTHGMQLLAAFLNEYGIKKPALFSCLWSYDMKTMVKTLYQELVKYEIQLNSEHCYGIVLNDFSINESQLINISERNDSRKEVQKHIFPAIRDFIRQSISSDSIICGNLQQAAYFQEYFSLYPEPQFENILICSMSSQPVYCVKPECFYIPRPLFSETEVGKIAVRLCRDLLNNKKRESVRHIFTPAKFYRPPINSKKGHKISQNSVFKQVIAEYLRENNDNLHLENRVLIDHMTAFFGISRKYFQKRFRDIFQTSCTEHLNRMRIQIAAHELTETKKSITEIQQKTGFNSLQSFSYSFKKVFGCSPQSYRKGK